jgi:soluble lytic murein transglycosylase-like protein
VRRRHASCLLALLASLAAVPAPRARAATSCLEEAASAERRHGLPPGLLRAIGVVESGRWSNEERAVLPSPFAVNAAGQSRFFDTAAEAAAFVAERQRQGVRLIDVGCFQIDLFYHPAVFRRVEDAFNPAANAEYAAAFLARLYAATHDWTRAVASYHSTHAGLGHPYAAAVLGAWGHPAAPALPAVITVSWQPSEWVAGVHVQRPSGTDNAMPRRAGPRLPPTFTPSS